MEQTIKLTYSWGVGLLGALNQMRVDDQLCDLKLVLKGNAVIRAHSCVLAAASPFLRSILVHSNNFEINMEDFPPNIMEQVTEFIYTGEVTVKKPDLLMLHSVAVSLNIPVLAELTQKMIHGALTGSAISSVEETRFANMRSPVTDNWDEDDDEDDDASNTFSEAAIANETSSKEVLMPMQKTAKRLTRSTKPVTPIQSPRLTRSTKPVTPLQSPHTCDEVSSSFRPKRSAGRPKRYTLDDDKSEESPVDNQGSVTRPPRRPGRPRKRSMGESDTSTIVNVERPVNKKSSIANNSLPKHPCSTQTSEQTAVNQSGTENMQPTVNIKCLPSAESVELPASQVQPSSAITANRMKCEMSTRSVIDMLLKEPDAHIKEEVRDMDGDDDNDDMMEGPPGGDGRGDSGEAILAPLESTEPLVQQGANSYFTDYDAVSGKSLEDLDGDTLGQLVIGTEKANEECEEEDHSSLNPKIWVRKKARGICANQFVPVSEGPEYACDVCGLTFSEVEEYEKHYNFHLVKATKKMFACSLCSYTSSYKYLLVEHVRRHTGERPYHCSYCEKTFISKKDAQRHENVHVGKKFECKHCGKMISTQTYLSRHIRRQHTRPDYRPFKCTVCNKTFRCSTTLREHQETHNKVGKFECLTCGVMFPGRVALRNHVRKKHKERALFTCPKCGKSYKQVGYIKNHKCVPPQSTGMKLKRRRQKVKKNSVTVVNAENIGEMDARSVAENGRLAIYDALEGDDSVVTQQPGNNLETAVVSPSEVLGSTPKVTDPDMLAVQCKAARESQVMIISSSGNMEEEIEDTDGETSSDEDDDNDEELFTVGN